ncbi:hypothetical protein JYU34_007381 [Plutella xylostella]|uniref:Ig-like domain-containing protein n=1 Tax=Plutella xylostella TaxID=51655 RepID=A0ABQ7QQ90_PLUXY|nr:hypothetical protein JYU34_007381 [Plutella xylostella]
MKRLQCSLWLLVLMTNACSADDIFETVEAVAGQHVELACNTTAEREGDKLNVLAWYKNGSGDAIYSSRDLRDDSASPGKSNSSRYRLVEAGGEARLLVMAVQPGDAGFYSCLADFASSPAQKTHVNLVVIEPPQRVWLVHENGSRVANATAGANASRVLGPYYVGDTVHLFCVVLGGRPLPALTWWVGDRLYKNTSTPLSEQRLRSDLIYGPLVREDHGLVLSCSAHNHYKTVPVVVDVVVDMMLPPELVSVRSVDDLLDSGTARLRAGEPHALQCRVLGSRPLPGIIWRINDAQLYNLEQKITVERSQRLSVSEVQVTVGREHDEAPVTCCAPAHRRDADYVCAEPLPLTVVFPPVLSVVTSGPVVNRTLAVVKGSSLTLNCSYDANPSIYELIWYAEDEVITQERQVPGSLVEPVLHLPAVAEADAGEYFCAASNAEGSTTSEPIVIDVTYPPFCQDPTPVIYGIAEFEPVNLTCEVLSNPPPTTYRWVLVDEAVNISTIKSEQACTTLETTVNVLAYQRSNETAITTIFCWGINSVINDSHTLPSTPCTFVVTDETPPQPPAHCQAVKHTLDITVSCQKGHDGGLSQKFIFTVQSLDSEKQLLSITNLEPQFIIQEPTEENYKFTIISTNKKGDSSVVEINKEDIIIQEEAVEESISAVPDITTLALSLCGGVALLALVACGLVLCAHERGERSELRGSREPAIHAYNTDESNCETYNDSDEGSEYNVRRTDSFRKAVSRYPSRNFDVRRTSSFHSARCMNDIDEALAKAPRHSAACRVHSMQNIHRKRDMDLLCDHLVTHLPPEINYNMPRPVNTFYTIPRKMRHKMAKELSDENSEITQNSDGFSLPPPPDEFGTYKSASRISNKDIPSSKTSVGYATVRKNDPSKPTKSNYNNVIISPMNTVGLPTISGGSNVYAYPDEEPQVNTNPFDSD